jgi:hypothetical protein
MRVILSPLRPPETILCRPNASTSTIRTPWELILFLLIPGSPAAVDSYMLNLRGGSHLGLRALKNIERDIVNIQPSQKRSGLIATAIADTVDTATTRLIRPLT